MASDSSKSNLDPHPWDASRAERSPLNPGSDSKPAMENGRQERIDSERESLELELFRVRRQADAARLDAKAAEIELQLRNMDCRTQESIPSVTPIHNRTASPSLALPKVASNPLPHDPGRTNPATPNPELREANPNSPRSTERDATDPEVIWYSGPDVAAPTPHAEHAETQSRSFRSWEDVRQAFDTNSISVERVESNSIATEPVGVAAAETTLPSDDVSTQSNTTPHPVTPEVTEEEAGAPEQKTPTSLPRAGHTQLSTAAPDLVSAKNLDTQALALNDQVDELDVATVPESFPPISEPPSLDLSSFNSPSSGSDLSFPEICAAKTDEASFPQSKVLEFDADIASDQEISPEHSRRKPAAWLVSAIAHAVILILLAVVTLKTHTPSDQVALSASSASQSETVMETFTIENSELETEPTETISEAEVQYDLSPVGEIAVSDLAPPPPPAMASLAASMLDSSNDATAEMLTKPSDSEAKIQFCGVDGGGNHFVYLVDSSKSMGDAFQSARIELLKSINALRPDQRFYVIFFDSAPDFMRLSNPQQDETRSAYATPQNKAALQRWAMGIRADRGKNPNDLLEFVLGLRADAIFLLSDGEFPQSTELLLREKNQQRNLFGSGGLISKVHTIAYYSRAGESRMKRIAEQNQGQYRYIAKP
ncbi:hypothetical protein Pla52o_31260 [Novipirellula galeiformis]|uniref:VWFA domain-containing protein n=1 Tax=Novipirellula galeiformis TaxID=2528004 RepID=A0A5C6CCX8_9BACT|nr:hypothetical protein [Novipirellula galeiformis]TWU22078.1 hypothetical protein Pla52o_31260 [Novipirellula galeiformis]